MNSESNWGTLHRSCPGSCGQPGKPGRPWALLAALASAALLTATLAFQGLSGSSSLRWVSESFSKASIHRLEQRGAQPWRGSAGAFQGAVDCGGRRWRQPTGYQPALPPDALLRALRYNGMAERLHKFAGKLAAGQPVSVVLLGGSVTAGTGGFGRPYPERFFEWIRNTFPNPGHKFKNSGMGGTTACMFTVCTDGFVRQDADLVVIELAINQGRGKNLDSGNSSKCFERLLRLLLSMPSAPAVLLLHTYSWPFKGPDGKKGFYTGSAEDLLTIMAQYYELPELSLRQAAYHLMRLGAPGVQVEGRARDPNSTAFYYDRVHPGPVGHQALADLLASTTWRAVRCLANGAGACPWGVPAGEYYPAEAAACKAEGAAGAAAAVEAAGKRGASGGGGPAAAAAAAAGGGGEAAAAAAEAAAAELHTSASVSGLPPPMVPGNEGGERYRCLMGGDFGAAGTAGAAGAAGAPAANFSYFPFRPDAPTFAMQKWSWTGRGQGAWVEFVLDTRPAAAQGDDVISHDVDHGVSHDVSDGGAAGPGAGVDAIAGRRLRRRLQQDQPPQQQQQQPGIEGQEQPPPSQQQQQPEQGQPPQQPPPSEPPQQPGGLDTQQPSSAAEHPSGDAAPAEQPGGLEGATSKVVLGYVRSYEGMGEAAVECVAGCTCERTVLNGTWGRPVSLMQPVNIWVTPHPECRLRVTMLSPSPDVKVSLTFVSVMVA